jgi:hypothetical protein
MSIILVRVDLAASAKEPEFVDGAGGASAPAIRPPLACAAVSSASPPRREKGRVYEAYEVKNKRQKLRCLLLRRKKKIIIFLFMM